MTVSAMVFGEAPGYWPLTTTVGGTISGYSLIGRFGIASRPATVINIASTVANMGRSMKNEEMFIGLNGGGAGTQGHSLRRHGDGATHAARAVRHNHVAAV